MKGTQTAERERTTAANLSDEAVRSYQENGFVRIRGIISSQEAERYRTAALELQSRALDGDLPADAGKRYRIQDVFTQLVNVWRDDPVMKELTLHANVAAVAARLAGVPLRLWHDHLLIKRPHNETATEFHQDQPYWPHGDSAHPVSVWIALVDVPVERGCMTFLPETHRRTDLTPQNLRDPESLFSLAADLAWSPRVTLPLRAGDCTFHHGRTAHMAGSNGTNDDRVAHVIIYMDQTTTYDPGPAGKGHVITDPLGLEPAARLEGELFPAFGPDGTII